MKKKLSNRKLTLNKRSIANLTQAQMSRILAGYNLPTQKETVTVLTNSNRVIDCTTRPTSQAATL